MYWAWRWAFRSSFRWARATYSGFPPWISNRTLKFYFWTYPKFGHSFRLRPWWPLLVSWSKQSQNPLIDQLASWARLGLSPHRLRLLPSMAPQLVPRRLFQSEICINFDPNGKSPTDFLSSASVMTLALVIEPKVLNASRSDSSVIESSKFLT